MTTELIREIAGHVLALGLVGTGVYMAVSGLELPAWLAGAIVAALAVYFPGMANAVRARFSPCC